MKVKVRARLSESESESERKSESESERVTTGGPEGQKRHDRREGRHLKRSERDVIARETDRWKCGDKCLSRQADSWKEAEDAHLGDRHV